MKMLAQKAQESAAERHYSLTANIQSKNQKRCLYCSEILQDVAKFAGKENNHGLLTVDEAAEIELE